MVALYVDQIMSRPVETVAPDAPVREAAAKLIEHDVGAVVVVDDADRVEGLLTATDFVLLVRDDVTTADATVADVMRTDVLVAERNDPVSDVVDAMLDHLIHHVPVVADEEVVGMVSTMDLTAYLGRSL